MVKKFNLMGAGACKSFIQCALFSSLSMGLVACASDNTATGASTIMQPELGTASGLAYLQRDGFQFKDLNKDGKLNPYEDWRLSAAERARDLVNRMTLEEKAGALLHGSMSTFGADDYDMTWAHHLILENNIGSVITRLSLSAELMAEGSNKLQALAEQRRLGIPLVISTDPRNHFNYLAGASVSAANFSQWPEALGFGAIGDPELVRQFGNVARQEYRAVGIHQALSPMADLSTEPRWPRIVGTFGEDADLTKKLVQAYIEGFQNGDEGLNRDSVAAVVKHWVGYGAAKDGYDSHNHYGRYATFPNNNFEYHIKPFEGAFAAHVSGVMPTYSILENLVYQGQPIEQVGAGYSHYLLTDLLRGQYKFDGVILSDWAITLDCNDACKYGEANGKPQSIKDLSMAWGVSDLSAQERYAKALYAGIDQFGGVDEPQPLIDTIKSKRVSEARIDESVYRVLLQKFELGLFENPFVNVEHASQIVGNDQFKQQGEAAQAKALVLLENKQQLLPLAAADKKVYLYGIDADTATDLGFTVVDKVEDADLAILRLTTPFEQKHKGYVFGRRHHEDNLAFMPGNPDYDAVLQASQHVPTIATVFLERPAIMTSIHDKVDALIGNFGVSDKVLLSVILGHGHPTGKLPIELPSSMAAVAAQKEDTPFDSEDPLYPFGYGLSYDK